MPGLVEQRNLPRGLIATRAIRPRRRRDDVQPVHRVFVHADAHVDARGLVEIGQHRVRHVHLPTGLHVLAPVGDDVRQPVIEIHLFNGFTFVGIR